MKIKYYKRSCKNQCDQTNEDSLNKIVSELEIKASVEVILGIEKAQEDGVQEIPALVIDDEIFASGYAPSEKEIKKTLLKLNK